MPVLSHDNEIALAVETFSQLIDWSYDLVSFLDGERPRWHEIVLHVHNDERISIAYSDVF
jgi:hypothetical protein